jgi:hypothetical protein
MLTRQTDNPSDTIARCGKCSIFALLTILSPSIIRENNSGPRDGISEVELNKALQVCKGMHMNRNVICTDCKQFELCSWSTTGG